MSRAEELADICDKVAKPLEKLIRLTMLGDGENWLPDIAAELRRLDAENAQLRAELERLHELERHNAALVERRKHDVAEIQEALQRLVELEHQLEAIYSTEPVAWEVYVAEVDNGYVVDDLDDPQLIDDMTNHDAVTAPLIPLPVRKS